MEFVIKLIAALYIFFGAIILIAFLREDVPPGSAVIAGVVSILFGVIVVIAHLLMT